MQSAVSVDQLRRIQSLSFILSNITKSVIQQFVVSGIGFFGLFLADPALPVAHDRLNGDKQSYGAWSFPSPDSWRSLCRIPPDNPFGQWSRSARDKRLSMIPARSYDNPLQVIALMLNDLRRPAGVFLPLLFPAAIQVFHLDILITRRLPGTGQ